MKNIITIDKFPLTQSLVNESVENLNVSNVNESLNISATKLHSMLQSREGAHIIYEHQNSETLAGDNIIITTDKALEENDLLYYLTYDSNLLKKVRKIILLCIDNHEGRKKEIKKNEIENPLFRKVSKKIVPLPYDEETIHGYCDSDYAYDEQISKTEEIKKLIAEEVKKSHKFGEGFRNIISKVISTLKSEFSQIEKYQTIHNPKYDTTN